MDWAITCTTISAVAAAFSAWAAVKTARLNKESIELNKKQQLQLKMKDKQNKFEEQQRTLLNFESEIYQYIQLYFMLWSETEENDEDVIDSNTFIVSQQQLYRDYQLISFYFKDEKSLTEKFEDLYSLVRLVASKYDTNEYKSELDNMSFEEVLNLLKKLNLSLVNKSHVLNTSFSNYIEKQLEKSEL